MTDILNLTAGMMNASGMPLQADASTPKPVTNGDADSSPAGFSDALLNVISSLLAEQGQTLPRPNVSAEVASLKDGNDDEDKDKDKGDEHSSSLPLKADAPSQLLEALLMSSQMPVRVQPELTVANSQPTGQSLSPLMLVADRKAATLSAPIMATTPSTQAAVAQLCDTTPPKVMPPALSQVLSTFVAVDAAPVTMNVANVAASASPVAADGPAALQNTSLHVDTEDSRWTQQLQSALGERLQIQVKNQVQHATIRLDPPDMGKIDISLQVDNGRVQVQISASHAEVYRALQQTSNDLRQSLTEQNFVQVNVQVSSQSGQQQGKGQSFTQQQHTDILAGADTFADDRDGHLRDDDSVLLTV